MEDEEEVHWVYLQNAQRTATVWHWEIVCYGLTYM